MKRRISSTSAQARESRRRLFFALWPPEPVRSTLAEWAAICRAQSEGRLVERSNLHATLAFLGMVDSRQQEAANAVAAALRCRGFELGLDRIGYWRHNRIVYAGVQRMPAPLTQLAAQLARELVQAGLHTEERPYAAHVTLLRDAVRAPSGLAAAHVSWNVDAMVLVESRHVHGGVVYQPLQRWTLEP